LVHFFFFACWLAYFLGLPRFLLLSFLWSEGAEEEGGLDGMRRGGYSDILLHRTPDTGHRMGGEHDLWGKGGGERERALLAGFIDLRMQTGSRVGAVLCWMAGI
jgi:hypothetical protein